MRKSDESNAGDVDVYQDISSATAGPSGKMTDVQLITQVLPMCMFKSLSFVVLKIAPYVSATWLQICIYADGKVRCDTGPAPVTPPQHVHLTINHLVFHKVLGKGSFGKVVPTISHIL